METIDLLDPSQFYDSVLKVAYPENANKLFDELIKNSQINENENRKTIKQYYIVDGNVRKMKSKLVGMITLKVFMIIFIVLFIIAGIALFIIPFIDTNNKTHMGLDIGLGVGFIAIAALLIFLVAKPVNKSIKQRRAVLQSLTDEANKLKSQAIEQMAPLNDLFDWNAPSIIVKKTTPLIELDPYFDVKKFSYLKDKYKFTDNENPDSSAVMTLSGQIKGNPFFLYRTYNNHIYDKEYVGHLTISWVETYTDSDGHTHTTTRTQTLTATEFHPAPGYYNDTRLVYANDAAPDLHFSREPTGATGLDEKAIKRKVKKGEKELRKIQKADMSDKNQGTNFTMMANSKFDVLFGAKDRDNEVQFRLLFTPLAQLSMTKLLIEGKPYGDDFQFIKNGPLNYIISRHSQEFDYSTSPDRYQTFSVDESRKIFVEYNTKFVTSLYFDLAPLLTIPLYQQHKPFEYIYKDVLGYNYTSFEEEVMANTLDSKAFMPKGSITNQILKVIERHKVGDSDQVTIKSHAFRGEDRVSYVPVYGGDGHTHNVPVYWTEYFPIEKDTKIVVRHIDATRATLNSYLKNNPALIKLLGKVNGGAAYQRGLFAFLLLDSYGIDDDKEFANIFNK